MQKAPEYYKLVLNIPCMTSLITLEVSK